MVNVLFSHAVESTFTKSFENKKEIKEISYVLWLMSDTSNELTGTKPEEINDTHINDSKGSDCTFRSSIVARFAESNNLALDEETTNYLSRNPGMMETLDKIIPLVREYFPEEMLSLEYDKELDVLFFNIDLKSANSDEEIDENANKYMKLLDEYITRFDNPNLDIITRYV